METHGNQSVVFQERPGGLFFRLAPAAGEWQVALSSWSAKLPSSNPDGPGYFA